MPEGWEEIRALLALSRVKGAWARTATAFAGPFWQGSGGFKSF
jgi:hypothetical protein